MGFHHRIRSLTGEVSARIPAADGNPGTIDVRSNFGIGQSRKYQCLDILDIEHFQHLLRTSSSLAHIVSM